MAWVFREIEEVGHARLFPRQAPKYAAQKALRETSRELDGHYAALYMCSEIYLLVSGLADDHVAARAALVGVVESMIPAGVVLDVAEAPEIGFEFVLMLPATMEEVVGVCERVQLRLARELDEREVIHAEVSVNRLDANVVTFATGLHY